MASNSQVDDIQTPDEFLDILPEMRAKRPRKKPGPKCDDLAPYTRPPFSGEAVRDPKSNSEIKYCNQLDCTYGSSVMTNLRKHLMGAHKIDPREKREIQLIDADNMNSLLISAGNFTLEEVKKSVLKEVVDKDTLVQDFVRMTVACSLPFRLVERPEFRTFLFHANPEAEALLYRSHNALSSSIVSMWSKERETLKEILYTAVSNINISLDIWTSPNNFLFLGVVGHFVQKGDNQVSKALLGLREVGSHSEEEQFEALLPVLTEYDITYCLGMLIGDNSTINNTLCRMISSWFSENTRFV